MKSVPDTSGKTATAVRSATAEAVPTHGRRRHGLAVALSLYTLLRAINFATLAIAANIQHEDLRGLLLAFDATWYADIAVNGYDDVVKADSNGLLKQSNLAFFPLYPALTAAVKSTLHVDVGAALLMVANVAAFAAAAALYAIGSHIRSPRTGILLAALWAVTPHAMVQSMGYSESVFTALAAYGLFALLRRQWLTAGILTLLAGLTRPTAAALIATVVLVALLAVWRKPVLWRAWAAILLAPLGLVGFMTWVAVRLGRIDGYFYAQSQAWNMSFDGGFYTVRFFVYSFVRSSFLGGSAPFEYAEVSLVLAAASLLLFAAVRARVPWPLLLYAAICLIVAFTGAGFYWSKARMLVPAFPLLLPLVFWSERSRLRIVLVITLLTVMSAFLTVYLSLHWKHSF
ncbi:hypothetical protein OHA21_23350 [Actinoplanes sp. NBC_00393]|uniref:hypothetical protein n=1 Tax=Actinoplanes sp. NBC_00393 TaxID=2975953 RepID=UPI002E1D1C6D